MMVGLATRKVLFPIRRSAGAQLVIALFVVVFSALSTYAHEGKPHHARDLIYTWGLDPFVIVSLLISGGLYGRGIWKLWREAGISRGIKRWEATAYALGWITLFVALVSPLHPMGAVLFSAHMTQHELLMLVAAPLMVLGKPLIGFLWALPVSWSRRIGGWTKVRWFEQVWQSITNPLIAWIIHAVSLWIWHVPLLFQATLRSDLVHTLQHTFFLGSALLFWWALIHGPQGAMGYGAAALYVFTTSIHSGVLGALITFSGKLLYPVYSNTTSSWGLSALEDQQLGGLIMWVPAGLVYIVAGLALCAGWLNESEHKISKRDEIPLNLSWKGNS
jgi:putative membrane protein